MLPVKVQHIAQATRTDPVLSHVLEFTRTHCPTQIPDHLQPYFARHNALTVEENCLLWGIHVKVPLKLRHQVLDELHLSHLRIARMKSLARIIVWWPNIDKDIEVIVRTCNTCQSVQAKPPQAPTHPWTWPTAP